MKIDELINELEHAKEEHGNLEIVISDYEMGLVPSKKINVANLDTSFMVDESEYASNEGDRVVIFS